MHIVETQIREEGGSTPAFRVEFCGDAGEVISVFMRQGDEHSISRENVISKARELMLQIGNDGQSDYEKSYEAQSNGDFDR